MAILINTKKTPANAQVTYWKIDGLSIRESQLNPPYNTPMNNNNYKPMIDIILNGYIDEATRRAVDDKGNPSYVPALTQNVQVPFTGSDYPTKAQLYAMVATLPDWSAGTKI